MLASIRWYTCVLLLLLLVFQGQLWFSAGGALDLMRVKKQAAEKQRQVLAVQEKNAVLKADTQDLKQGGAAIEERAREVLGMLKQGEVFYQMVQVSS